MPHQRVNTATSIISIAAAMIFLVFTFLDSPLVVTGPHGSHALERIEKMNSVDELKGECGTMALQLEAVSRGQRPLALSFVLFALAVIAASSLNLIVQLRSKQE